jgi:RNA polymerase sigma factor for flagellar operon FliA
MVNFIAERMRTQVPGHLTRDDIVSAAMHGLVDAAGRFDPERGALFKTFAEVRMRGAIIDEVRRMDQFSRTLRDKHSRLTQSVEQLEKGLGRIPEEAEIAHFMEMTIEDYRQLLGEVGYLGCVSLNESLDDTTGGLSFMDTLEDCQTKSPLQVLESSELTGQVAEVLEKLSEKERLVIALYYYEELAQKEIAEVMGLTEGRVSQLHSQALVKLKASLGRNLQRSARIHGSCP